MTTPQTPAAQGYRMPAEWEPHAATWLSWPLPEGISFPGSYEAIIPVFVKMVDALRASERVYINVPDADFEQIVRKHLSGIDASHVSYQYNPTNECWCRDHGPIFLKREADPALAVVDWGFNAWGGKYLPSDLDDAVPTRVGEAFGLPVFHPGMVLEGGSIDVNGSGSLLTTTSCLLHPNRNPAFSKTEIEQKLKDYLDVTHILWLKDGIEGDDTDGHIDDITRFVRRSMVVTVFEEDPEDANFAPLEYNLAKLKEMQIEDGTPLHVLNLPMPAKIVRSGQRLPASYANFYIANKVVLLPIFHENHDAWATSVLQQAFPDRRIIGIDCRELIWGLGAFHCLTQQQPA